MNRLAIITTHPIQYNAPWFRLLAERGVGVKVFYTWSQSEKPQVDNGFGRQVQWNIPLLEGYDFEFVSNLSPDPGLHHFNGIFNPELITTIERFNPDVVLVFGWNYRSHLLCLRHFKNKIPIWFRGDSTLLDERLGIKKWGRRLFLRWVYRNVDRALYVGKANKAYFRAHGMGEDRLSFIPHAIDNERFGRTCPEIAERVAAWRHELGFEPEHFVLLFAGKMELKKNPFFMLQLASKLKDARFRFLMVGNGVLEEQLKQEAGNDDRIVFLDFQNQQEMTLVYRLANLFILPSNGPGETWGLAVNEAMATGIPVLVSRKAGCAVDLVNSETGYSFEPGDTDACSGFILRLYGNEVLRTQMSRHGKELIAQYSFNNIITGIERLLATGE
jgi:glycosyltransferase involved in cell wall biosynthesis